VSPIGGILLAFRRSDNSWHGHEAFVDERKVIQFNWLPTAGDRRIAMLRHHASAAFKRVTGAVFPAFGIPSETKGY
jgi:SM-20-related protein